MTIEIDRISGEYQDLKFILITRNFPNPLSATSTCFLRPLQRIQDNPYPRRIPDQPSQLGALANRRHAVPCHLHARYAVRGSFRGSCSCSRRQIGGQKRRLFARIMRREWWHRQRSRTQGGPSVDLADFEHAGRKRRLLARIM